MNKILEELDRMMDAQEREIEFCEMSEEQFNIVFPKLEELGKRFKDAGN